MSEVIRRARPGDEAEIVAMIRELADFENAADECVVTVNFRFAPDRSAAMAAAAEARGIKLIILEPIPPIRPDLARRLIWRGHVEPYLAGLSQALPAIAAARGARVQDPLPLLGVSATDVPDHFRKDALHLTPAAYAQLNALLPPTLAAKTH